MQDQYANHGPLPRPPSCMLRSLLLMLAMNVVSITHWVETLHTFAGRYAIDAREMTDFVVIPASSFISLIAASKGVSLSSPPPATN